MFVGRNAQGQGVLEHYSRKNYGTHIALVSQRLVPGADYTGVTYDQGAGNLYVLDAKSKSILRGAWDGRHDLSKIEIKTWATVNDTVKLYEASDLMIWSRGGPQIHLSDGNQDASLSMEMIGGSPGVTIEEVEGSLVVTEPKNVMRNLKVYAQPASAWDGGVTIHLYGEPGTSVEVVEIETQSVIASGVLPPSNPASRAFIQLTLTTKTPFVLGKQYYVREVGGMLARYTNHAFECISREGTVETVGSERALPLISFRDGLYPGGSYRAWATLEFEPHPGLYKEYPGWLALALDTPDRSNHGVLLPLPEPTKGPSSVINPDPSKRMYLFALKGWVGQNGRGHIKHEFNLVDDPSLVGFVVLSQFAMHVDGELKLSPIASALVHPGPAVGGKAKAKLTPVRVADIPKFKLVPPNQGSIASPADQQKFDALLMAGKKAAKDK